MKYTLNEKLNLYFRTFLAIFVSYSLIFAADDKIVVTDQRNNEMYVAPMSLNPDLSSSVITFSPALTLTGGPGRVRWDAIEQKLFFTLPGTMSIARSNIDGTAAEVVTTAARGKASKEFYHIEDYIR